ncbi:hemolysin-type calcium-binding protein [Streptococcus ruminantium]|uniref:Hemolysin-type calcium-binding protein n=2 Tax=Streptococcus ruminantium TaxID=1917441 RepID=A0A2Z5TPK7_9STRE|nr:hemolysin-type calcium-binding protein [Streptococcus ruminantium]
MPTHKRETNRYSYKKEKEPNQFPFKLIIDHDGSTSKNKKVGK